MKISVETFAPGGGGRKRDSLTGGKEETTKEPMWGEGVAEKGKSLEERDGE